MSCCMILVTCSGTEDARSLAAELVRRRLAACVQLEPVTSIYTWNERVETEAEIRMVIKTRTDRYPDVEAFILERHPYEVPQIIRVPIEGGLPAYLNWVDQSTRST